MKQAEWKRLEIGGQKNRLIQTSTARNRRTVLSGRMCGAGIGNGKTGAEAVFSKPEEQFGEKSMFNKEKYLVLARDIPVPISHICCSKMKKLPMKAYQHKYGLYPILGTLAEESRVRKQGWIRHGCNAFQSKSPSSQPLSFWTEQDILAYIVKYGVEICSVYGEIVDEIDGCWYDPKESLIPTNGRLRCTGCDRTGQSGWCNPYCSERIKMNTLRKLEKDWWSYGKDSRAVVRDTERAENH